MSIESGALTLVPWEFPVIHSDVYQTNQGTSYLKRLGVVLVAAPAVNISGVGKFLDGFLKK